MSGASPVEKIPRDEYNQHFADLDRLRLDFERSPRSRQTPLRKGRSPQKRAFEVSPSQTQPCSCSNPNCTAMNHVKLSPARAAKPASAFGKTQRDLELKSEVSLTSGLQATTANLQPELNRTLEMCSSNEGELLSALLEGAAPIFAPTPVSKQPTLATSTRTTHSLTDLEKEDSYISTLELQIRQARNSRDEYYAALERSRVAQERQRSRQSSARRPALSPGMKTPPRKETLPISTQDVTPSGNSRV